MVIVRISSGLANQMYEFASAYALAKELKQELVLDISECVDSAWDYCLDYFKIPDVRKIVYHTQNTLNISHSDPKGILDVLRKNTKVLVEEENMNGDLVYKHLDMSELLRNEDKIYMCGYFFSRDKYYLKYWDEIREIFKLRNESAEISHVKELIKDKISVGVHIRRGDMLLAEWAIPMEDDYYRAAIECCREYFGDCIFLIFSDDIEYAKSILGQDDSLYYVHFFGYSDADLNEFISLSLCDHRIMSNSSTFSRLADELNWKEERKTFWKDITNSDVSANCSIINFKKRNIRLNQFDIKQYSGQYRFKKKNILRDQYAQIRKEILFSEVNDNNYKDLLDKIYSCSINVFHQDLTTEKELTYKRFLCLVKDKQYSNALQSAYKLYNDYSSDKNFFDGLIESLLYFEAYEEAIVEAAGMGLNKFSFDIKDSNKDKYCRKIFGKLKKEKKQFVIIPYAKMIASSKIISLVELGLVLKHLKHDVSFVFSPLGNEEDYIRRNRYLTNRREVCLGCSQYVLEDVQKIGIDNFLNDTFMGDIVIISRLADFFIDKQEYKNGKITYVFLDFSDNRDAETEASRNMDKNEWKYLYEKANLILTKQEIKGNEKQKIVNWEDNDSLEIYSIVKERWELGREHRLSKRAIGMAADLLDSL